MRLGWVMPPGMIAVACAVGFVVYATRPTPSSLSPPPVASALPIDVGVRTGERVAGWDVVAVTATDDGGVAITMARDGVQFALTVVPQGVRTESPPFSTDAFAVYYGHARPTGVQIPAGALRAISAELLRRLEATTAVTTPRR